MDYIGMKVEDGAKSECLVVMTEIKSENSLWFDLKGCWLALVANLI